MTHPEDVLVPQEGAAPSTNGHKDDVPIGTSRKALTAAQIRQSPPDCREEWLHVEEWDGDVLLRSPTALAAAEIKAAGIKLDEQGNAKGVDIAAMERAQVRFGMVEPALSEEDVEDIQQRMGPSWQTVIAKLDELAGPLGKPGGEAAAQKDAERRFRPGA